MSNAKEMPVTTAATSEQARAEESVNSTVDYSTDGATLQEGKSVIAIIPPIPSVRERPKPRNHDIMGKLSDTLQKAAALRDTGADTSAINAFLKGAMKTDTTKPRLKQAALESVLDEMGISIRYNRVTHDVEFSGNVATYFPDYAPERYFDVLPVEFSDMLCDRFTHAEKGDIESYTHER